MLKCRLCKRESSHEFLTAREMVHGTREVFQYSLCGACGSLALLDAPPDLSPYYRNYYSTAALQHSPLDKPSWIARYLLNGLKKLALRYSITHQGRLASYIYKRKSIKLLAWGPIFDELRNCGIRVSRHTRFLDVGSGRGTSLHYLAEAGFERITGCDPFIDHDIDLFPNGKILKSEISEMEGVFDLIMFHHSFEHLPDPAASLKTAVSLLAPGGAVILRFPNIASIEFLTHRGNWWGIHAPRHFFIPSQQAVRFMATDAGLKVRHSYCDSSFDHYLYSTEYELNLHDSHPLSFRADSRGLWTNQELRNAEEKSVVSNRKMCGDWIAYILDGAEIPTAVEKLQD